MYVKKSVVDFAVSIVISVLLIPFLSPWIIMRVPLTHPNAGFAFTWAKALDSGGLLYQVNRCRPGSQRSHLTLHGNGKYVSDFALNYKELSDLGYCVYTLEYSHFNYGPTLKRPEIESFQTDVKEAVRYLNDPNLVIFGGSFGASVLASVVHELVPQPAQIGFIGGFANTMDLAESFFPGGSYLMGIDYGIRRPFNSTYGGSAVVIHATGDFIVPISNGYDLCLAFPTCQAVTRVQGWKHVATCLQQFDQWSHLILPAFRDPELTINGQLLSELLSN